MHEFKATERCDRCGAQANHSATKNGFELLFCSHHYRENREALINDYWLVDPDLPFNDPVPPVIAYTE